MTHAPRPTNSAHEPGLLAIASIGCALTVLDSNVVAVVLPTIGRQFDASFSRLEWIISSYVLCFASLLLAAGALADRFGRRRVYIIGLFTFALASFLCGAAASANQLIAARALQGAGAALLLAPALALIANGFVDEGARNRAWAIWGSVMGLTMVLAPSTGGLIARFLGWRWTFYLNLPICAGLIVACAWKLKESRNEVVAHIDVKGMFSFSAMMLCLVWYLISGPAVGWLSSESLLRLGSAVLAFVCFLVAERSQAHPMLDLRLFTDTRLLAAVWAMFAYACCAQVMATFLPQILQNGFGLAPLDAGVAMLPFGFTMLIFPHVGRKIERFVPGDAKLAFGLAVVAAGNGVMGIGTWFHSWVMLVMGMLVLGAGGGILNGETQKAIMRHIPRERAGMASGISTTARFSGILIGFAILSGLLLTTVRLIMQKSGKNSTFAGSLSDAVVAGNLDQLRTQFRLTAEMISGAQVSYLHGAASALGFASILAIGSSALILRLLRPAGYPQRI